MRTLSFCAIILFLNLHASGYEVDQFTHRDQKPKDSTDILDQEFQNRLELAVEKSNKGFLSSKCNSEDSEERQSSRTKLFQEIRDQFVSSNALLRALTPGTLLPIAKMEKFINENPKVDKRKTAVSDSIYQAAAKSSDRSKFFLNFGLAPVITVNGVQVGTDKFGHLFDQGYNEYVQNYLATTDERKYLNGMLHSFESEKNEFGGMTTGVFSYADISANYAGQKFWENICGNKNKDTSLTDVENIKTYRCKKDAYTLCNPKTGKWELNPNRKFTLKDYVTPAWDESINCSLYKDDISQSVTGELSRRVHFYKGSPKQPCPAEPQKCTELKDAYPNYVSDLLVSPVCQKFFPARQKKHPVESGDVFSYSMEDYSKTRSSNSSDTKPKSWRSNSKR